MGEELAEDFSNEELEILGEDVPESEETDTEEQETPEETDTKEDDTGDADGSEETDEQAEEEESAEEDENRVPQKRVDKIVYEREETQRKLDLLKRDPNKYYQLYPDEKPDTEEKAS